MTDFEDRARGHGAGGTGPGADGKRVQRSPGKRTLTEARYGVQRRGAAAPPTDAVVHDAAEAGLAQPASALPHADRIQAAFGHHDVGGIEAHVGGAAAAASGAMGAEAYATGNHVAFSASPDLHTAAHEAAHVIQQRAGVSLLGGVGEVGDRYEQHADAVADRVVRGESAEGLLDQMAPGGGGGSVQRRAVQRVVKVNNAEIAISAWDAVKTEGPITGLDDKQQESAKEILEDWIDSVAESSNPLRTSQNREYASNNELARALAGEVKSHANLVQENTLAAKTMDSGEVLNQCKAFIKRLAEWHDGQDKKLKAAATGAKGRYSYYYSNGFAYMLGYGKDIAEALASPPGDISGCVSLASDYALKMRDAIRKHGGGFDPQMSDEHKEARGNHWNPNEDSDWVKEARQNDAPLSAGPSATTMQMLTLADKVGASDDEKKGLAWGIFAFFNRDLHLNKSGTHRFHEVMSVAAGYGVPYVKWQYGEVPE